MIVGLTGIVSSPLHGAQEEGLKGFFKGVGKGVLGLVTKPFGGVADGMTIVLEGIERATDLNEMPVMRCRIPRFISPTQVRNDFDILLPICMFHSPFSFFFLNFKIDAVSQLYMKVKGRDVWILAGSSLQADCNSIFTYTWGDRSLEVATPRLWNGLALELRCCSSLTSFKKI